MSPRCSARLPEARTLPRQHVELFGPKIDRSGGRMPRGLVCLVVALVLASVPDVARPGVAATATRCPPNASSFHPLTSADFQTALNCAQPGAVITLRSYQDSANGVIYSGNFTLRYKAAYDGTNPITIQSDAAASLAPNRRVSPSDCRT